MKKLMRKDKKAELRKSLMTIISEYSLSGRLPSERDLAATLGVSRYLLRDCLQELSKENIIKRGKNRQGTTMLDLHPWTQRIGVVFYDGRVSPCIDQADIFKGIMNFFSIHGDYMPQILNFSNLNDFFLQMKQYELDGCIWLVSHYDYPEEFASLPEKELFRYVFVSNNGVSGLSGNQLYIEQDTIYNVLRELHAINRDKIAYIAIDSPYHVLFKKEAAHLGIDWDDSAWIGSIAEIDEKLYDLIHSQQIDALVCDGPIGFYEHTLAAVSKLPKNRRPIIASIDNWRFRKALAAHPELNGMHFLCESYAECYCKMGKTAGEMLTAAIQSRQVQKSQLFSPEIYSAAYTDLICASN